MSISGYISMIDKGKTVNFSVSLIRNHLHWKTVVVNKFIINTDRQDPRPVLMRI